MNRNVQTAIKVLTITTVIAMATGCASTGTQEEIDALKTRVDLLEQEVAAANAAAAESGAALTAAEEAQASLRAARHAPDLTPAERALLRQDAADRAAAAGQVLDESALWLDPF